MLCSVMPVLLVAHALVHKIVMYARMYIHKHAEDVGTTNSIPVLRNI